MATVPQRKIPAQAGAIPDSESIENVIARLMQPALQKDGRRSPGSMSARVG
jgi:hypothetical protein